MQSYEFMIQSRKEDIDFINKILEAYEGVGVVRTVDAKKGVLSIITTMDFKEDARFIILDLAKNYDVEAVIIKEEIWQGKLY